ncbi:MAG: hypothetical protein WD404_01910 [Solirubrobacterales bacterium]
MPIEHESQRAWLAWLGVLVPVLAAAAAYLALQPPSVDLAAQLFRSELFASHGFLAWNNYWYGGHYLLGYSLLFPPLGGTIGATLTGALAALAATGLFGLLARRLYGPRARLATLWFGAGMISMLLSGRLTFVLGVAIGLAALLLLSHRRLLAAVPLAAATSFASPVAGFFLLLIGVTLALDGERRRGAALGLAAAAPIAVMSLAFPTSGPEPFVLSSLAGTLAIAALVLVALPRGERLLRRGVAVYAAATVAVFAIPNALGGNIARLSNIAAASLLVLGLAGPRRRLLLVLLAAPLLYWQWQGAVRDVSRASGNPSVQREFYTPLLTRLEARSGGAPVRIEIPPTQDRWEVYHMTPQFLLARGWLRQLETRDLQLFRSSLSPTAYRNWLDANGVSYVALPRVQLDYLARHEAALIRAGLPYLEPIWRNADWRLFAVRDARGLVDRPASLTSIGADWFDLRAPLPGSYLLRIHFSPHWTVSGVPGACLRPLGRWTQVELARPGSLQVGTDLSAEGLLGKQRVCAGE